MKFKITAEVEIDDESSHLPVTCDAASMKKEGEKVVSDIVKDLLYDIDDIEINSIKVTKVCMIIKNLLLYLGTLGGCQTKTEEKHGKKQLAGMLISCH